jgi:hypothetical protein
MWIYGRDLEFPETETQPLVSEGAPRRQVTQKKIVRKKSGHNPHKGWTPGLTTLLTVSHNVTYTLTTSQYAPGWFAIAKLIKVYRCFTRP